jgi:hypothetical protein
MIFSLQVIGVCLFYSSFVYAQQNGDATSLNAPNCGLRPLISSGSNEPSKIVGGTQTLAGRNLRGGGSF